MSTSPVARPLTALVAPTLLERVFEHPERIVDLVDRGAPYKTLAAVHKDPPTVPAAPWFRNFWALGGKATFPGAEEVFHNPLYIEAAKELFGAKVVTPLAMMTNLNAPSPAAPPHLDLPFFRGAHKREVPSWLLAPMGYSGLFHRWAIPMASALTWIYAGPGGEFEYWPAGLDEPSLEISAMSSNQGVMADNEYTYHRVCQVGSRDDFVADNTVPYDATLELDGDEWSIRRGTDELARYARGAIRISVLWKAYCFADESEAHAFTSGVDDLTPSTIVEMFQDDLKRRGVAVDAPADLGGGDLWGETIRATYGISGY
ncbi:MAG: hypothetical protein GY708_12595 [Actinomycetia bacterium]|nr:hypothetical protein [Actinomycetes bacterium]MCP4957752.1 hypothetical protein [Actinomycetes bacterium]